MKWPAASETSKDRISAAVKGVDCEFRKLFGFPVYFINGNMFAGLFGGTIFIRHSEKIRDLLEKGFGGVRLLTPMPGRPMKDYAIVPGEPAKDLRKFVRLSAEYTRSLPPKNGKKPARRRGRG